MEIVARSSAKINLFLKVTGKRPDGYHEIFSAMQMVELYDTLTFQPNPSGSLCLTVFGMNAPSDGSNLVMKAAEALRKWAGVTKGARIELIKRIPVSAGLGGGSGDAACALKSLAKLWDIDISRAEMERLAVSIGADVPFFLNGPCALVTGIGEIIERLSPKKSAPILMVKPDFGISTAEAYKNSRFDFATPDSAAAMVEDAVSGEPSLMARSMLNDLMPWAMEIRPELARLKERMEAVEPAPVRVMMSGSGPTLFALYDTEENCRRAADKLKGSAPFVLATRTSL